MKRLAVIMAVVVTLCLVADVSAAEPTPAQNKLLAKRAAQVDAYRNLAETIKGFQIDSKTTVKDFVTESDEINTAFSHFIKGVKVVGEPRYYEDETCEVDVEVTVVEIITTLKRIVKRHHRGGRFNDEVIDKISTYVTRKTVTATGAGAPRMAREEEMEDDYISPPPIAGPKRPKRPPLWKKYRPVQRLKARRAAKLDAYRNLAEQIKGLSIDSKTTVRDFVTESDVIRTSLTAFLRGVKTIDTRYNALEPIVEMDVEVTMVEVITILKRLVRRHHRGGRYNDEVIDQIRTKTTRKLVRATGYGTVSGKPVDQPPPFVPVEEVPSLPGWATKTVRAIGFGVPPDDADSAAKAKLAAKRAAKNVAYRNLFEEIGGVQIDSETTVKDFVTESDEIRATAWGFIRGARVVRYEEIEDGTWECEVEITLHEIYKLYKKYHP